MPSCGSDPMAMPVADASRNLPPTRTWRLRGLVIFGILLATTVLVYRHFWLARPTGSGPAGPAVPAEPFQQNWLSQRVMLLGIGDSMTAGLGASRPDLSYFARLINNPVDEFADMRGRCLSTVFPSLMSKNIAVSGSNSLQHLQRIAELPAQDADVLGIIVVTSGGNDLIHWYGRSTPREGAM